MFCDVQIRILRNENRKGGSDPALLVFAGPRLALRHCVLMVTVADVVSHVALVLRQILLVLVNVPLFRARFGHFFPAGGLVALAEVFARFAPFLVALFTVFLDIALVLPDIFPVLPDIGSGSWVGLRHGCSARG